MGSLNPIRKPSELAKLKPPDRLQPLRDFLTGSLARKPTTLVVGDSCVTDETESEQPQVLSCDEARLVIEAIADIEKVEAHEEESQRLQPDAHSKPE